MKMDRSLQDSYRFCGDLARREARNFYCAFLLLPPAKRRSMCALYAFLRHTDDLADEPGSPSTKFERSTRWRTRARRRPCTDRRSAWPGLPALADTVSRHAIPADLLEGDRRRFDGRRAAPVRDVRRTEGLLLSRCVGRRAMLHSYLGISLGRGKGRAVGRVVRDRAATDQHHPRRP